MTVEKFIQLLGYVAVCVIALFVALAYFNGWG